MPKSRSRIPELGDHLPVGLKTSGKQHPRLSALVNSL